jgi:hypothetical protein
MRPEFMKGFSLVAIGSILQRFCADDGDYNDGELFDQQLKASQVMSWQHHAIVLERYLPSVE